MITLTQNWAAFEKFDYSQTIHDRKVQLLQKCLERSWVCMGFKFFFMHLHENEEKTRGVNTGNDPLLQKSPLQHVPLYCPVLGLSGECSLVLVLHIKYCKSFFSIQPF